MIMDIYTLEDWGKLSKEQKYRDKKVYKYENEEWFKKALKTIDYYICLLEAFDLTSDFYELNLKIYEKNNTITHKVERFKFINTLVGTLYSLKAALNLFNFADAYILLRKYKDDFILLLYVEHISQFEFESVLDANVEKHNKMVQAFLKWALQKIKFDYKDLQKEIQFNNIVGKFFKNYGLQNKFKNLTLKFNDYAHSNGFDYLNKDFYLKEEMIKRCCEEFVKDFDELNINLFCLLYIVNPKAFGGVDFFLMQEKTQEDIDKAYELCGGFVDFLEDKVIKYNGDMINFLKENTYMNIR